MTPRTLFRLAGLTATSKTGRVVIAALKAGAEDALEPLIEIAMQFRGAGGVWTAKEWAGLTPHERGACVTAARRLDGHRARYAAAQIGYAMKSGGAAGLMAEFDGGAAREVEAIEAALARVEAETAQALRGAA